MSEDEVRCPYCGSSDYVHGEFDDDPLICNSCGKPFIYTSEEMICQGELHMPKLTDEQIQTWREGQGCCLQPIHIEPDSPVQPLPCVMDENGMIRGQKVKLLLSKIDEELNELKQAIISFQSIDLPCVELCKNSSPGNEIAEEAADTITAITTLCEAFGIDAEMRDKAQRRVNEKNRERGRL